MVSQFAKVGTCSPTGVQLCRLSFRPLQGSSEADSGEVANPNSKNKDANEQRPLFGPRVHVSHRFVDSHRETGGFGAPSHETDSVALEESLARARGTREGDSSSQISVPSSAVVAGRKQCAQRPTSSSSTTCSAVVYRRLKRRLGRTLRRPHGKRSLVGLRKPVAHKLSRAKGGPSGPQEVRATVLGPDHFDSHGQHNGCLIHQQGGGYEIRLTLCPPLETAFLVQSQTDSSKGQAHSGKAECDSRQIVQEHSGYSDRMVPPAGSLRPLMCQVAHSPSGSLCNKVQSQTTQVCVPSTRSAGMESRCSQPELGEYGCLRVPSCVSFGQGGVQDPRSGSSQVGSDCSRVAQHALVLGSSQHVCSDSSLPSKRGEPADPTVQSVSPQRSPRAQPPRLAPRASSIQAQGFSNEVATRIEAPQRQSTRAIYESKWSIFVKWCESHKVDFGSPSLTQVAEFLLFLFKEKNLQPSTIDGYRTAIADKIGCDKVNFGKDENLTRLLDSFHRDKPKGLRGVPSWNLSQHNGCLIHQQGGGYEIRLTLCPPLETAFLVQSQTDSSKGQAHSGKAECDSRQIVQEHSGYSDRMVPPAGSLRPLMCQVAHSPSGSLCNKVQSQTTQVCVPSTRSAGMESRCSQPELGEYGCLRVPSCVSFGQGGVQDPRSGSSQVGSDCSRVAQHALVLGSSQHVCSDSSLPSKRGEPADPTVQSVSPQRSPRAQPPRLAPRASSIQAQGFSNEVATRIEAPQRQSTRAIYESKWSIFVKWCESHKVDFGSPSLTQVAEFLLFLFKEKNLQPSTIDGYRTAIADKIGCDKVNFGKDENLTRLLDSFHRDKPKGLRGVPSWNLSLVLHQLTQSPFEPLRKASLKHLTFKTVFLLALGSGKRRSEIHAWVHRNIRHQEDWANVSLFPSPCFLSKNQLAKEGPSSVAPVIIPALAPTLDKSLKEDRTLCPVRALRYYLDKTKDLRSGKQLVFVSFKKNFNKDIAPATISSWIKQTILLCYQLSNEDAQQLHQVRARDVRAFAASKAFQGGVSLDQILSACHWKSHNTFTQFYLKDVAWADADLYHLGPVVAAQHIRE